MFDKLRTYFEQSITLTDEQFALMQQCYIPRKMKRGEFLMRAGEVAQYGAFVARGCLRSYHIDEKGKEHILQFAPENWWISDMGSLLNQEPSLYFIDAVEDSDALLVDVPSLHNLIERIPQFAEHYRLGLQKHAAAKNRRIISSMSATAEERYQEFLQTYPSIALRVPQHMLASYLGITPETLSRVRKQLSRK
jgi:CRP/FNR family transcriptional regulator, anaerobic regulatory protein